MVLRAQEVKYPDVEVSIPPPDQIEHLASLVDVLPGYVERSPSGKGVHASSASCLNRSKLMERKLTLGNGFSRS